MKRKHEKDEKKRQCGQFVGWRYSCYFLFFSPKQQPLIKSVGDQSHAWNHMIWISDLTWLPASNCSLSPLAPARHTWRGRAQRRPSWKRFISVIVFWFCMIKMRLNKEREEKKKKLVTRQNMQKHLQPPRWVIAEPLQARRWQARFIISLNAAPRGLGRAIEPKLLYDTDSAGSDNGAF